MAEGDDGQEKTEEPTPKKRQDARDKGQIATSKEMFVFGGMAGATAMLALSKGIMPWLVGEWAQFFTFTDADHLETLILAKLGVAFWQTLLIPLVIGLPLLAMIGLMQAAVGGLVFAPDALGFKPEKIDPLKGLQRMVSMQSLVELGKALLKVVLLVTAAGAVLMPLLPVLDRTLTMAPGDAAAVMGDGMIRLLTAMTLALAVVGGVDLAWQLHSTTKKLRMSRQEIKDEMKQSEGSPEVKGQLRRLQMEASRKGAQRQKALADVPNATTIITNPVHFAVALRYVPDQPGAPTILALGRGPMAHEIIARGKAAGVTVLQAPPLARALYFTGEIGAEISDQLYTAVAAVLAHVYRLDNGIGSEIPQIDLPDGLMLDEFGHPLNGAQT
ncbi:flagellar biosynthesis protein FlhB [Meridianimarinicoccus roseus]|uniref:Flagellar biosynthesis protein FlhB n=1 Tax=Meridianimarinicoccus roseus TaxID=2072018 RepID=A0A2V2LB39_9RHOB|nr:EscU/YscU/HrcU family type III secretion system export apparatus switch protein [Meridianimarinicoccus roseus]PWR02608.1 flagellar biosynthesis protein FlhB [Meridianimarinicoccus roseus]